MKILVTGRNGQVGWELRRSLAPLGEVVALDRNEADLGRPETLNQLVDDIRPNAIVNAAAYTAVDQAETDEKIAHIVNGDAVAELARAAKRHGSLLIHYSTDYVFDGNSDRPYVERDSVAPLNAYGRSKLAGERAIEAEGDDWLTLRTTWVYGTRGRNFLRTMLRLAQERETLRVVGDQTGAPTSARMIADLTAQVLAHATRELSAGKFESGLFHMTAAGATTWHGFAEAIVAGARVANGPLVKTTAVESISTDSYPTPARRPRNSLLNNDKFDKRFNLHRLDWQMALELALDDLWSR